MQPGRDDATPLGDRFRLEDIILGLASDLEALRKREITIDDARVRAELAKQVMNGVRLVINAQKYLEANMRPLPASEPAS